MTDTATQTDLWLGIVSPDFLRSSDTPHQSTMPDGDDDSRTYFVRQATDLLGWVRLVVSDDDPRGEGFYHQTGDPEGHKGWNVEARYVTRIEEEPFPIGSVWRHRNAGIVVVTGAPEERDGRTYYPVARPGSAEPVGSPWIKGALEISERVEESREEAPTEASVTLTESELEEKLRQAREEATREERARLQMEHARWVDSLVEDAHQYANDNSLCSEFDRFMEEHDLPSREQDYYVTFRVSVTAGRDADGDDLASLALENIETYHMVDWGRE